MHARPRAIALLWLTLAAAAAGVTAAGTAPSEQEYWAEFDHRDWRGATETAERLVAAARADAVRQPLALSEALALLGNAQLASGDFVSAESSFREALQLAQRHARAMSAKLLDPMRGLGYTLAASGKHEEAAGVLERALLVAHRNYGLFDPGQQGILRQLAASLTRAGRLEEAGRRMAYLLQVAERAHGKDDPDLVPTLCIVGGWYSDVAQFGAARETFHRALQIVEKKKGPMDLAAVPALRGLARSYTLEVYYSTLGVRVRSGRIPSDADGSSNDRQPLDPRYLSSAGEKALQRALDIIEAQPEPSLDQHIDTLIQLGDWMQTKHQPEDALPLYRHAAQLIEQRAAQTQSGERGEPPEGPFSFPTRVWYPAPWLATRNLTASPEAVDERYVQLEFTVTSDGSVAD